MSRIQQNSEELSAIVDDDNALSQLFIQSAGS